MILPLRTIDKYTVKAGATPVAGTNTNMIYTVYLWHGIYYRTELQPGDTLKRIEYKDRYGTTHIWVKN